MKVKVFAVCIFSVLCSMTLYAESAVLANKRTALRCLETASRYIDDKNWAAASSQAQLGLGYDDTLSDLWYVWAVSSKESGEINANVLSRAEKSLSCANWVNYNRDNARLLYADMLTETGLSDRVSTVLDSVPVVKSASADFIRAKSCYRINTMDSFAKARNILSAAAMMYPDDARFPLLFFQYENPETRDTGIRQLAAYFLSNLNRYGKLSDNPELEIRAIRFADANVKSRLLASFSAKKFVHPLYAKEALQAGLLDEKSAFEYLASFADESLNLNVLLSFVSILKDKEVLEEVKQYFDSYSGTLTRDCNYDGIDDLTVHYYRGRPENIIFDSNQDGLAEWEVRCDFGLPVSGILYNAYDYIDDFGRLGAASADLSWFDYPALSSYIIRNNENEAIAEFNLLTDKVSWTPVSVEPEDNISNAIGSDFYFPKLNLNEKFISREDLAQNSSSFTILSKERENAFINFVLLDGKLISSDYYSNDVLYARCQFVDNVPSIRVVDCDCDGVFETTEVYDFYSGSDRILCSTDEEKQIIANLFGTPSLGSSLYLKMIQVDLNKDTVPDFTMEYTTSGEVISSWDTDSDGKWNLRTIKTEKDGKTYVKDMFYDAFKDSVVSVDRENGLPISVTSNDVSLDVTKDSDCEFYWIGDTTNGDKTASSAALARKALKFFAQNDSQGVSSVIEDNGVRALAVHIGDYYYGKMIEIIDFEDAKEIK